MRFFKRYNKIIIYDGEKNKFNNIYFNELLSLKDNKKDRKNNIKNIKEKQTLIKKIIYLNNKNIILLIILLFLIIILKYSTFNNKQNLRKNIINLKICLCAIGKNENLYIKEFVEHYKKIGYNRIFLYDNNDIDDERFEDKIKTEIDKGFVKIINYRGYKGKLKNPQLEAYKDCYERNNKYFNWLSFFDIDEYLEFNPQYLKAQHFFNKSIFNFCKIIHFNWLFYINVNNSLYYENKPLKKRMTKPLFDLKINRHIKSTVRGNLSHNYWKYANNPHTSINNFTTCSSSGRIITFYMLITLIK